MRFFPYYAGDYRLSINTQTVLDHATRTAEFRGKEKYVIGSVPSKWLMFAPTFIWAGQPQSAKIKTTIDIVPAWLLSFFPALRQEE